MLHVVCIPLYVLKVVFAVTFLARTDGWFSVPEHPILDFFTHQSYISQQNFSVVGGSTNLSVEQINFSLFCLDCKKGFLRGNE